uniref:Uncharacterized protein n=1 Tax=Arundo donax TaxID=35708 RepID=A0A0A9FEP2_ARUDO
MEYFTIVLSIQHTARTKHCLVYYYFAHHMFLSRCCGRITIS